ncbi:NADH dehydrogenase [ubiquinone] 1 subunit C1, mitochondrial [Conger conger]|uniref:NADH dehydrogenase [ubiquinone] 1 subunit C1, mitochondrial n=1 Tax=Conger conger TaxID=82655 RepID=UPI002A5A7216|nr:NADH dehydrogenase [ubiquinone] 1 subunit C1, mitochondrial [Conger conger]
MSLARVLLKATTANKAVARSAFTARKPDYTNINWLRVGLAFGTSAVLWGLLFKQHSEDVHEYKKRNGLE